MTLCQVSKNNMKLKLYIDFDGVILDSIDVSYKLIEESGIALIEENYEKIQKYYQELDWNKLLKLCSPINDSINNIKKIIKSNLYDVCILTHVYNDKEIKGKQEFIDANLKGIDVIYVNKKDNKCDVVDCKNAILVDDYMGNLDLWENKGGIPIKFSTTGKEYNCMSIDNLGDLIKKYDEIKELVSKKCEKNIV